MRTRRRSLCYIYTVTVFLLSFRSAGYTDKFLGGSGGLLDVYDCVSIQGQIAGEEIFLVHFLQELLSTTRYIIARIETDQMLQRWSGSMQDMKAKPMNSGFVSSIQEKLLAMNNATIEEFKDLFKHIIDRFQIGNTLFGTVQELQNFY